jgi:hypothetical protein
MLYITAPAAGILYAAFKRLAENWVELDPEEIVDTGFGVLPVHLSQRGGWPPRTTGRSGDQLWMMACGLRIPTGIALQRSYRFISPAAA